MFAPQLALQLGLTSKQTNAIMMSANSGGGPFTGLLVDARATPLRYDYTLKSFYDSGADGLYSQFGLIPLLLCQGIVGAGSSSSYAGFTNGCAKAFSRQRRATVLSICIACLGLSAFIYSTLAASYIGTHLVPGIDSTSSFLCLLAFGTGGSIFLASFAIQPRSVVHNYAEVSSSTDVPETSSADSALDGRDDLHLGAPELRPGSPDESTITLLPRDIVLSVDPAEVDRARSELPLTSIKVPEKNLSGRALLCSLDFWALFLYLGVLCGCGLMYINNIGTIVFSLPSTSFASSAIPLKEAQHRLVALLSITNCLGRLCYGPVTDYATRNYHRLDRTWFAVPIAATFVLANLWVGSKSSRDGFLGLEGPTALVGFAYGSMAGSTPVLCIDWFGLASFSTNLGLLGTSPAIFGNVLNLLFGAIYDSHSRPAAPILPHASEAGASAEALSEAAGPLCSLGQACFHEAFQITTGLSCLALGLAIWMGVRRDRLVREKRKALGEED
ncbi:BQ2448_2046 [Microbotryum intermedium]|uniref:BQ2448_2046 protein n=1 Tax=Microbotryum intermedium TaxID=269621 RepID=A0A238FD51_9BASI|nr:BQ2448_2046 [Microbotryum intermedium]